LFVLSCVVCFVMPKVNIYFTSARGYFLKSIFFKNIPSKKRGLYCDKFIFLLLSGLKYGVVKKMAYDFKIFIKMHVL